MEILDVMLSEIKNENKNTLKCSSGELLFSLFDLSSASLAYIKSEGHVHFCLLNQNVN